jgi:hypothetical protein
MALSGKIHRLDCKRLRRTYKAYAVIGDELEAGEFIKAQKLDASGSCFPELRDA